MCIRDRTNTECYFENFPGLLVGTSGFSGFPGPLLKIRDFSGVPGFSGTGRHPHKATKKKFCLYGFRDVKMSRGIPQHPHMVGFFPSICFNAGGGGWGGLQSRF